MDSATPVLIETVRIRGGAAPLLPLHLARLKRSCLALGIPCPPGLAAPIGGPDRIWRAEISQTGVMPSERPLSALTAIRLGVSGVVHRRYPHKRTDRDQFLTAQAEATQRGLDDAVLLTPDGWVAEGTIWCLFWWEGEQLCAPPLELGILPGVSRARIAKLARGGLLEQRLDPAGLAQHSLFVSNAAQGIVQVQAFDGHAVPEHDGTKTLAARFWP